MFKTAMIVFPVLIPVQNFLFPGTGRENLKCHGKGRDGKFEACIPGNHGKREFPLTPGRDETGQFLFRRKTLEIFKVFRENFLVEFKSNFGGLS